MRSTVQALALGVASLVCAATAHAAGGEEGATRDFFYSWLNLLLILGVIVFVARKPLRAFFSARRSQVQEQLHESVRLKEEAQARLTEWQGKLAEVQAELDQIRNQSRVRAEAEASAILADARASAERIRNDARAAIEQELRRAQATLRDEASDLAVELAGELLSQSITDADRDRLIGEFIEGVERAAADGAGT